MEKFDFKLFEKLKSLVTEGIASSDVYNRYKEMVPQEENIKTEISELRNQIAKVNMELRTLRHQKASLQRRLEEMLDSFSVVHKYKSIQTRKTIYKKSAFVDREKAHSYLSWYREGAQIYAEGKSKRTEREYRHNCPILHFKTIMEVGLKFLSSNGSVEHAEIEDKLVNKDLGDGTKYRHGFKYRIGVVLSVLEQESLIKWLEKRRPYKFGLIKEVEEIQDWFTSQVIQPWLQECLKNGDYNQILKLENNIPQNEVIKGIFLAAKAKKFNS